MFKYLPRIASIVSSVRRCSPSALYAMSATLRAFMAPTSSPSRFWDMAKTSERLFQAYTPRFLENAAVYFKSTRFTDITSAMNHIVSATTSFRNTISQTLESRRVNFDVFSKDLEGMFTTAMRKLETIPLPDKPLGKSERAKMVDTILDVVSPLLQNLAARYEIEEEVVIAYVQALKPWIHILVIAVSEIVEQDPDLFPTLAFSVATMLIPELRILRPFLRLFGFGPVGSVNDSAATRRFWKSFK